MSLYFTCPHKHVYNLKKLAGRTIWRDYIDQIRIVATALNICKNNIIFYCNVLEKICKTFCIVIYNVLSIVINKQNTTIFEPVS